MMKQGRKCMNVQPLTGTDHTANYHYCLRIIQKLTRGRSIGILDVEALANDAAYRFHVSTSDDKKSNSALFLFGICRNVYREACRQEAREKKVLRFAEIPDCHDQDDD